MSGSIGSADVTDDAFLGDALKVLQPRAGYRAGIDAVLLAASVAATGSPLRILDMGAGVGVVGLCAAARIPAASVVLVEREPSLAALAQANTERNGLAGRVSVVTTDLTARVATPLVSNLQDESFDAVVANPPFHASGQGTSSRVALKAAAHEMPVDDLEAWARFAARMTRPGGTFTIIHKADAAGDIIAAFARRFGALRLKPVYARPGEPAIRVLVQGIKGSRARMMLAPPLVLHDDGHAFTPEVDAILRHSAPLAW
jgi:tRNA1(Val) A37 N6-methylase TrmN6